jgi:hypothetical protein
MQKASAGYTAVIGKTGLAATAIAQKVVSGYTQVSGK